jgi:tRNA(Ile)-lysidine synthase
MFSQVESVLQNDCCLDRQTGLLVAVSGGPDSLCLLHVLWQLGYPLVVAHLDHGLRAESATEAEDVQRLAESLGVPWVSARREVQTFAAQNSLSIEEAARNLRYRFLFEQAEKLGLQAVAVGHTADDQVETVLMHLLRGAGLSGLRGMSYRSLPNPWSQTIPLVRPLLGVWREEIMEYVSRQGLQPTLDASNLDRRYYRNRLRHELIPHLEALNPGARQRIWRMASLLRDEEDIVEGRVDAAWRQCRLEAEDEAVAFDTVLLSSQPKGLQRRLVRRAIALLRPGLRDIDLEAVERTLEFLAAPTRSGRMDLAAGLRLEMAGERLWVANWDASLPAAYGPQLVAGEVLEMVTPGQVHLAGRWSLQAEILPVDEFSQAQARSNTNSYRAWLDLDRLAQPLKVRARHPGERFRPLGMGGHSLKLSDFMVNVGLPRQARAGWPLVVAREEIIWVPGYRIAETASVEQSTQRILRLTLGLILDKEGL